MRRYLIVTLLFAISGLHGRTEMPDSTDDIPPPEVPRYEETVVFESCAKYFTVRIPPMTERQSQADKGNTDLVMKTSQANTLTI